MDAINLVKRARFANYYKLLWEKTFPLSSLFVAQLTLKRNLTVA